MLHDFHLSITFVIV